MEDKQVEKKSQPLDYNVYNALNLMDETLGKRYIENGFNPFENGFILDEFFMADILLNQKASKEINSPKFIEMGITSTKKSFNYSIENCTKSLEEIETRLSDDSLPNEIKDKLKQLKRYLLCRIEMLNAFLIGLKKDNNSFNMYKKICALNWEYCDLFDKSYESNFNQTEVINNIILNFNEFNKTKQEKIKKLKILDKAKSLLEEKTNTKAPSFESATDKTNNSPTVVVKKPPTIKQKKEKDDSEMSF